MLPKLGLRIVWLLGQVATLEYGIKTLDMGVHNGTGTSAIHRRTMMKTVLGQM